MSDAELAQALTDELHDWIVDNFDENDPDSLNAFYVTLRSRIAGMLIRVRLEEAKLIRDEYIDLGGWELVNKADFDAHIAALEQQLSGKEPGA